jgi:hypothetical protein
MTTIDKIKDSVLTLPVKYFVDIGASCYTEASESELLFRNGWEGLMFECDPAKFPIQEEKLKNTKVKVLNTKVNPENILKILRENNVPDGFYLTLDIDGYDFFVLDKILSEYKPSVIVSEINEKIPANIKFSVKYDEDYFWDGSHYFGYSLGMLEDILKKYNYKIKVLDFNNVILIPGQQTENLIDVYNDGYLNRPERPSIFFYNADFEPIYSLDTDKQIEFINNKFKPFVNERQGNSGHQLDGKPITYRNFILEKTNNQ